MMAPFTLPPPEARAIRMRTLVVALRSLVAARRESWVDAIRLSLLGWMVACYFDVACLAVTGGTSEWHGLRVHGDAFAGKLVAFDAGGRAVFETPAAAADQSSNRVKGDQPQSTGEPEVSAPLRPIQLLSLPLDELVRWGQFRDVARAPVLWLNDGSMIVCQQLRRDTDMLSVEPRLSSAFQVPVAKAIMVGWQLPRDTLRRTQFVDRQMVGPEGVDRVVLANGDSLLGHLTEMLPDRLLLKGANRSTSLDIGRVSAAVFDRTRLAAPPESRERIVVGLSDGSRIVANALSQVDGRIVAHMAVDAECRFAVDEIVALQVIGGSAAYLSDLPTTGYRHLPFVAREWPYRRDRGVSGGELRVGGRTYLKGLGMHSAARITFDLDREYRAFEAELAIDDSAKGGGSVSCRVFVDEGDGNWQARYASPIIRGGDAPVPVSVGMAGAKRISLIVDFAERGDERDDLDWLDSRLLP